jgi:hypothetical protein
VSGTIPIEVCPAGLDGEIVANSSWPTSFGFWSCVPLDAAGRAVLPATGGLNHVAFALRPQDPTESSLVTVRVSYTAVDSFVDVVPPTGTESVDMKLTYIPRSATTGARVDPVAQSGSTAAVTVKVTQGHQTLTRDSPCDFGSEIDCVGNVIPDHPVTVELTESSQTRVVLTVTWR